MARPFASATVVEVLGKLAVEALAGGFGQADDIAFRSATRVAAAPLAVGAARMVEPEDAGAAFSRIIIARGGFA